MVRDAVIQWQCANKLYDSLPAGADVFWSLPVVAETYDGKLNDINGFHITKNHAFAALDSAASGPVVEGNVGGGTGMSCHQFKGGIGTASRKLDKSDGAFVVGVLVQALNYSKIMISICGFG